MSVWFGVKFLITRGVASVTDEIPDLILAILYIIALLSCIFLHIKFRNKTPFVLHKFFLGITSLNFIALIWLIFTSLSCRWEGCMAILFPMFIVLGLWFVSFIIGIFTLIFSSKKTVIS